MFLAVFVACLQAAVLAFGDLHRWFESAGESMLTIMRRLAEEDALRTVYTKLAVHLTNTGNSGQALLAWLIIVVFIWVLLMVSGHLPFTIKCYGTWCTRAADTNTLTLALSLQLVMLPFVLAMILVPYSKLRQAAESFPSALHDVGDRIEWTVQMVRGAPSNRRIHALLKLLMDLPTEQQTWLLTKLTSQVASAVKSKQPATCLAT